jgi:anti-sigma factor RsiW
MSCEKSRKMLLDAASGAGSRELESHLSGCERCRAALAEERALLDRIDSELRDSLETEPSLAFLPAVRRRVDELRALRQSALHRWMVPALATLVGLLVGGHFLRETARGPAADVSPAVRTAAPAALQQPAVTDYGGSSGHHVRRP